MNPQIAETIDKSLPSEFWKQGCVSNWYLKPKQALALDFISQTSSPFFEASRRYGKTTTVLAYVLEQSIKTSGLITRWCEPWKNQCREIVMPEMDQIQAKIPIEERFRWQQTDSVYIHPNASKIYLRGVNEDRAESARGPKSDIIVADEIGSWREPTYVLNEVLRPQLLTTNGKLICTGTPPRNLAHVFYDMKDRAIQEKRFIQRLIHEQELVSWEQVEKYVLEMGGWDSSAVRRELLCEKVIDKNFAIIPEWDDRFVQDVSRDAFFQFYGKYDSLDIGVRDNTVCLFAYYDFKRAALIILDEVVLSGPEMTTERLAEEARAKETEHFGIAWERTQIEAKVRWKAVMPPNTRMRRVSDIDLRMVNDMSQLHGLYFEPTDKGYLEEMVNEVRVWVGNGRVLVNPRCKNLIECLKCGIWDEDRKQWERSERLGHFDALASLMYMIRNVDRQTNPIPMEFGKSEDEYFFSAPKSKEKKKDALKKIFNVR